MGCTKATVRFHWVLPPTGIRTWLRPSSRGRGSDSQVAQHHLIVQSGVRNEGKAGQVGEEGCAEVGRASTVRVYPLPGRHQGLEHEPHQPWERGRGGEAGTGACEPESKRTERRRRKSVTPRWLRMLPSVFTGAGPGRRLPGEGKGRVRLEVRTRAGWMT